MKRDRIIFYVITGLLALMMTGSAAMYIFNTPEVAAEFAKLGFPLWIIYPLAVAKVVGAATLLLRPNKWLPHWAYSAFFFEFLLAAGGHLSADDGEFGGAVIAIVLLLGSFFFSFRAFPEAKTA